MAITAAERHEIAELLVLMFNAAPGATALSQIVSVYESVGHNLQTVAEILGNHPVYTSTHPNFWTGEDFAANLLTPLGLGADVAAKTAIVNAFNGGMSMADITYNAYLFLNAVTANPGAYGAQYINAAAIMNNKADVSIYYSVTKGLQAGSLDELEAVLAGVTANTATVVAAKTAIDHANDPQLFTLTTNAPSVTEGNDGTKLLTFTLTLHDQNGGAPVANTTVNYATTNTGATATANDDYVPVAGSVTFAPGQTTATVSVTILGDTAFESNETIKLLLSGAALAASVTGTGTITNDDPIPQINLTPSADVVVGTALGETINGTQDTFTLDDNIDGAGGDDTLKLVFDGTPSTDPDVMVAPFVTVKNVEHVVIFSDLSVGSDGGDAFDMSTWTGVNTIEISAASGADVNIKSAASQSITIVTADNVTVSDDVVASITVTNARGHVYVDASDATSVHVVKADGYVYVNTNNANIAIDNAGHSDVAIFNGNGTIAVSNASDAYIVVGDSTLMNVSATSDVTIIADDITTVTAVAGDSLFARVNSITTGTFTGEQNGTASAADDVHVSVTGLHAWVGPLHTTFGSDATVSIGGEDNVSVDGGSVEHVSIDGSKDAVINAGVIGSVTIGGLSDDFTTVAITTYSDDDLSLTLAGASINELTLVGMTTVNLAVSASSSALITGMSTVETINLTGAGNLVLNAQSVDGTLSAINGAAYTGNLSLEALAFNGSLHVTSGTGNDSIFIDGNLSDVIVAAGAGTNVVDVDSYGMVQVTVGDGNDDVTVNFGTLAVAGSFVALGEGTNALTLRSYDPITNVDLDAFDTAALPLTGNLMALTFAAQVSLALNSQSTLDVSGLDGPVSYIGFGDVDLVSNGEATLTIAGTGTTLIIQSSDDFGSDNALINLEAVGVTNLTMSVANSVSVSLAGDALVNLVVNSGSDASLILNGDTDANGTPDTLQALLLVDLNAGSDADVTLSNLRHSTVVGVDAGEDATVAIDYSTLGAVTVNFGQSYDHAEFDITGTVNSTVTVGAISINDDAVTTPTDADNGNSINIAVSDNDFSTVTTTTLMASADGNVDMTVHHNNHATVSLGDLTLTSRFNAVTMMFSDNTDNEVGADAIVTAGKVMLSGKSDAELQINSNVDAAVTLGDVTLTTANSNQLLDITLNDESTIKLGNITMTGGVGTGATIFEIVNNDAAKVTTGDLTITSASATYTFISVTGQSETEVVMGDILVTTSTNASAIGNVVIIISDNTDSSIDIGSVTVNTKFGDVVLEISENTGVNTSISLGDVALTATTGNVNILVSESMNFDADITLGNVTLNAGGIVDVKISGVDTQSTVVGTFVVNAGGVLSFDLNNVEDGGNATLTAVTDAYVNVHSLQGNGMDSLSVTAGNIADVTVSDVSELSMLTVSGVTATVMLDKIDSTGGFTLDISGVSGTATVNAVTANFNSTGSFVNVLIGHGNVNYSNDLSVAAEVPAATNLQSREKFDFGYGTGTDDVGNVVIASFNAGATAAVDGTWTDRLDFSHLTGVASLEDITFTDTGNDVVIDFVNSNYGSITLTGVGLLINATDLVVASIIF